MAPINTWFVRREAGPLDYMRMAGVITQRSRLPAWRNLRNESDRLTTLITKLLINPLAQ
jgi:hypothetical protein